MLSIIQCKKKIQGPLKLYFVLHNGEGDVLSYFASVAKLANLDLCDLKWNKMKWPSSNIIECIFSQKCKLILRSLVHVFIKWAWSELLHTFQLWGTSIHFPPKLNCFPSQSLQSLSLPPIVKKISFGITIITQGLYVPNVTFMSGALWPVHRAISISHQHWPLFCTFSSLYYFYSYS